MRAPTLRLWLTLTGQPPKPLPPPYILRSDFERRAHVLQQWLPYCGLGVLLVLAAEWGMVRWSDPSSDPRFAYQLSTQTALVGAAVWLARGAARRPEGILWAGIGMLLAMIASSAIYAVLLPGPTERFTLVVICYLLSARLMLPGGVREQLVVAVTCVVAQVAVMAFAGYPALIVAANATALALVSALLLLHVAVTRQDQLERLYRRQLNRVAFALANQPTAQADDVGAAVSRITELVGRTVEATRVEVWLPDDERTVMRWIDGWESATGTHPQHEDVPLGDRRAQASPLDQEPLVQSYELPAPAGAAPVCPHVDGARVTSLLEAAVRVRGKTGVLCFQQEARRRVWTNDERRFASYMAHLVALAIEASERHRAHAALRRAMAEAEQRSTELSQTVAVLNEHIVERRNVERQLRESRSQLRALSTRLLQVQEEERRRMAREIHDELGQTLTALHLDVAWLSRRLDTAAAPVRQKLERMADLVDGTVESVQAIARNLRPPLLDDVGLAAAIEWQAREFEARTGIACRLTLDWDDGGLDADRSIAVFRLVQEALTNVARHAQATRVAIALHEARGRLLIAIRDNGRGIRREEATHSGALGLIGMRERVHLWGGRLRIQGRAGKGTLLRADIPLLEALPAVTEGIV